MGTFERWLSIPETNIFAPKNGWLEYFNFLLGRPISRCELLVSGRVAFLKRTVKVTEKWPEGMVFFWETRLSKIGIRPIFRGEVLVLGSVFQAKFLDDPCWSRWMANLFCLWVIFQYENFMLFQRLPNYSLRIQTPPYNRIDGLNPFLRIGL